MPVQKMTYAYKKSAAECLDAGEDFEVIAVYYEEEVEPPITLTARGGGLRPAALGRTRAALTSR